MWLLLSFTSFGQSVPITGKVVDDIYNPLMYSEVYIKNKIDSAITITNKEGFYTTKPLLPGIYYRSIKAPGFYDKNDSISHFKNTTNIYDEKIDETILYPIIHSLKEVKITGNVSGVTLKNDTMEFNSMAFKVNPDADASDLIKKMPSIRFDGSSLTAQGDSVTKVVVDGKPFFGSDPNAALKNLPADIIDKIQIYDEKSDREKLTGFHEGNTTKTINIITKSNRKKGIFGKSYAELGEDNSSHRLYGASLSLNNFDGDSRITLTGQSNNVGAQNFSSDNALSNIPTGLPKVTAGGINYSDKPGKKVEISASYFINKTENLARSDIRKTYVIASDSGQIYNEANFMATQNYSHRCNMRFNYTIDSFNNLLLQPKFSFRKSYSNSEIDGSTEQAGKLVNQTTYSNNEQIINLLFYSSVLYSHKFAKKNRALLLELQTNKNDNQGKNIHKANNVYFSNNAIVDTINQQTSEKQNNWNMNCNASYINPIGKAGSLKIEYNINYVPILSRRNTAEYSPQTFSYSKINDTLSNNFLSNNLTHKCGSSYLWHNTKIDFSLGVYYEITELISEQTYPISYNLNRYFQNVLPIVSLKYIYSKYRNLQCNYISFSQAPSTVQLQNVLNNTDPIHLYIGNPLLRQSYNHSVTARYNETSANAQNIFSVLINGMMTQHSISSGDIVASSDTMVEQHYLLKGTQLTIPINVEGWHSISTNMNYGFPLSLIKCRLNFGLNGSLSRVPTVINGQANFQTNHNGGFAATISSNISDNIDFTILSSINLAATHNSINAQLNSTYINTFTNGILNVILKNRIVVNTSMSYTANSGLSAFYNQNYLMWNAAFGKKFLKKNNGDIRVTVNDILNQGKSIQHSITGIYIQDTHNYILRRYFMLVFTYKINEFKALRK